MSDLDQAARLVLGSKSLGLPLPPLIALEGPAERRESAGSSLC